jgi:hypothetical protein
MAIVTAMKKRKMVFPKLRYVRWDNFVLCYGFSLFS